MSALPAVFSLFRVGRRAANWERSGTTLSFPSSSPNANHPKTINFHKYNKKLVDFGDLNTNSSKTEAFVFREKENLCRVMTVNLFEANIEIVERFQTRCCVTDDIKRNERVEIVASTSLW